MLPDNNRTDTRRITRLNSWVDGLYQGGLIPASLFDLLSQMLAPDPTCRLSTADALQHVLWKGSRENRAEGRRNAKAEVEGETLGSPNLGI